MQFLQQETRQFDEKSGRPQRLCENKETIPPRKFLKFCDSADYFGIG